MTYEELAECVASNNADTAIARAFRRACGLPMPRGRSRIRSYGSAPTRREVLECMAQRHGMDAGLD